MSMFSDMLSTRQTEWIDNPCFENESRVNNWRNYVPDELKNHWSSMSVEARQVAIVMAESQSDKEEWD